MLSNCVRIFMISFLGLGLIMQHGCMSSQNSKSNYPSSSDFPDYTLIDARYNKNLAITVDKNSKFAVVVKDLAVTAYSNLDTPKYDKDYIFFAGSERCCAPAEPMMGAAGLLVYRFHTLNKSGKITVELISRHKGLDTKKEHYDSDIVTKINVRVK